MIKHIFPSLQVATSIFVTNFWPIGVIILIGHTESWMNGRWGWVVKESKIIYHLALGDSNEVLTRGGVVR